MSTPGRSVRFRLAVTFGIIAALHVAGAALLVVGAVAVPPVAAAALGLGGFVYLRGLAHAFDFDHVSMIDNSTRKFVTEGRRPVSVGLAFSAGHSTVVIATGVLVVAGAGFIRVALDPSSHAAHVLAVIGLAVSGTYLLLVALANTAGFRATWQLHRHLQRNPSTAIPADALSPQGLAARLMTAPLRRVRAPRHVYLIGMLFSLGFDTSSQIGLLMITASAALGGVPPIALLALPFLFTSAMTLGDTVSGLLMLKMYDSATTDPRGKLRFNLLITGVSIISAICVGVLAASALLEDVGGVHNPVTDALNNADTTYIGYGLATFFVCVGLAVFALHRRGTRSRTSRS